MTAATGTPTTPATPATPTKPPSPSPEDSMLASKRRELLALDAQKKSLRSEAEAIISELTAEHPDGGAPVGIDSPLVDAEGFPRGDIDVYRARTQRKRFKEIQTDHEALERRIAAGLLQLAALTKMSSSGGGGGNNGSATGGGSGCVAASATAAEEDEEEKRARSAPKPKPKFDPKTGKWVVRSWDGSVAGVEDGETRAFDDLEAVSTAALAANLAATGVGGSNYSGSVNAGNGTVGGSGGDDNTQQQQQQSQSQTSSSVQQQQTTTQHASFQQQEQPSPPTSTIPFAIIDEVSQNSPASAADLRENDVILQFGHINHANHREFRAIAELVPLAASRETSIAVVVRRTTMALGGVAEAIKTERAELRPMAGWGGRGLLGCHIVPYGE